MERRERWEGLDHLRGLLALAVVLYHYLHDHGLELHWTLQRPLELLGLYAVSTFYVLSGCALFLVYHERVPGRSFLVEFWIKRAFRIVPLFWLATAGALALDALSRPDFWQAFDPWRAFLNFSLLFAWLEPTAYYAPGAWSIGNEWFFYALFPLMLWASRTRLGMASFAAVTLAIAAGFAFRLSPDETVSAQWALYVNPLNQLPLFLAGLGVGHFLLGRKGPTRAPWWLPTALLAFVLLSYGVDRAGSVSGLLRFVFIGLCTLWCAGFGLQRPGAGRCAAALRWLGAVSYSVYLLHPLVRIAVGACAHKANSLAGVHALGATQLSVWIVLVSLLCTLGAAHVVYRVLELPAGRLGRAWIARRGAPIGRGAVSAA